MTNNVLAIDSTLTPDLLGLDAEAKELTEALAGKSGSVVASLQTALGLPVTATMPATLTTAKLVNAAAPPVSLAGATLLASSPSLAAGATTHFIFGTSNDDLIRGTAGVDAIYGFAGNDTVFAGAGNDRVFGGLGNDVLFGEAGNDQLFGGTGDDVLDGGSGNDQVFGDAGDDILQGSQGNDVLDGGAGTDIADYSALTQAVTLKPKGVLTKGSLGTDTIKDVEIILGAQGKRNLIDSSTSDAGSSIQVNLGTNQLNVFGLPNGQSLGFQVVEFVDVNGTSGADTIIGDARANTLNGLGGNDLIDGADGNDTLNGGDGNDQVKGGAGNDTIDGGAGDDQVFGDAGNDRLRGSQGNDILDGGVGTDTADYSNLGQAVTLGPRGVVSKGSLGTDAIKAIETIVGAIGQRNLIDNSTGDPGISVNVNLGASQLKVLGLPGGQSLSFKVTNFLDVNGTSSADTITGDANANVLNGLGGNDTIEAAAGDDVVNGGSGDDRIIGGVGNDQIDGDVGTDTADYSNLGQAVTLGPRGVLTKGSLGTDSLRAIESIIGATNQQNLIDNSAADAGASVNVNLGTNQLNVLGLPGGQSLSFQVSKFPNVNGTSGADTITGDALANILNGLGGNDTIDGADGNDTIDGGAGDDVLMGGAGNDRFIGSSGNDIIDGGTGMDVLDYSSSTEAITYRYFYDNINISPPGTFPILIATQRNAILKGSSGVDTWTNAETIRGAAGLANGINFTFIQFSQRFTSLQGAQAPAIVADLSANSLQFSEGGVTKTLTLENFVNVTGSYSNDTITGNAQNNVLNGYVGSDTLVGGAGDDLLVTDENDTLTGGMGADRFQFLGSYFVSAGRFGVNFRQLNASTVTDFQSGSDQLVLTPGGFSGFTYPTSSESSASLFGFQGLTPVAGTNQLDPSQFLAVSSFGAAFPSTARVIYNTSTGELFHQSPSGFPSGLGAAKFAMLQGAPTLSASDIVIA
jgi:Ca2+-binding RTX toxin-like protein